MTILRAAVIIDYQNVHLTGHGTFSDEQPRHTTLINPGFYARRMISTRNRKQRPGHPQAQLQAVHVFRGEPSSDVDPAGYSRNHAQRDTWVGDPLVSVALRPLTYRYQRTAEGRYATTINGKRIPEGKPEEKGVDVMCALALVRVSLDPDIDLVILASADSDLAPAIDEVRHYGQAKVETASWWNARTRRGQTIPGRKLASGRVWDTQLDENDFIAARDLTPYH